MRIILILVAAMSLASTVYADGQAPPASSTPATRSPEFRSFAYARLGYGGAVAESVRPGPAVGFGFRGETRSFAVDVSFLNFVIQSDPYSGGEYVFAGSTLRLQGLLFLNPDADRSVYVGGGLGWGFTNVGRESSAVGSYPGSWTGSGLHGELTTGYEFRGSSPLRAFIQTDVGLPFYRAVSESYSSFYRPGLPTSTIERRYIPSVVVSVGLGWGGWKRRP
jgi:hypothetical protein